MTRNADDRARLLPIMRQFGLDGEIGILPGGSRKTFRVGNAVLKRIHATSLENDHSPALAEWIAEFSLRIEQRGFRLPRPLPTLDGRWVAPGGWTAWTLLEGRHATRDDIPACIAAIEALHAALKGIPIHPLMIGNSTLWGKAHRWCWGEKPPEVHPKPAALVDELYALRRPIQTRDWQLIHGDLNPENILIAPGLPPAFLDFSPFWAPPEFALAIFANFSGPRRWDPGVLDFFAGISNFDQLLVRAAIRMLLIMTGFDDWETCSEKWAAEWIIQRCLAKNQTG